MIQEVSTAPELSVVLVTPDCYETIAKTLNHLRVQTVREKLEVVIVAPSIEALGRDVTRDTDFFAVRVVEVGDNASVALARAIGIRQAAGPVVAIAEDHCFPTPTWAAALIEAHKQPWAGVGPVIANANPGSAASWAQLFLTYGLWVVPHPGGIVDDLPGHNSSYKRQILLEYGPRLEAMMEVESVMHADLRARGHQLFLEPAAVTSHLNITRFSSLVQDHYHHSRMVCADISEGWSAGWRVVGAAKALLMIPLHLVRVLRKVRRAARPEYSLPALLPVLTLGAAMHGIGDAAGFLLGPGESRKIHWALEFHRDQHLAPTDTFVRAADHLVTA